jgi:hypothetical protein
MARTAELPEFFPELAPTHEVSINPSAMKRIREEIRENGRYLEVGGWLLGDPVNPGQIVAATGPGSGGPGPGAVWLGTEELEALERLAPHLRPIGDWHLHPSGDTLPSEQDRKAWARGCDLSGGYWIGLVFKPPADMWSRAEPDAFVTLGTETTKFAERLSLVVR